MRDIATTPAQGDITQLLTAWRDGDRTALDRLMPLVYDELRRRAGQYMNGQRLGHTLRTTDLAHEAFLKLVQYPEKHWQNRAHFLAVAAQAMRHVLVDYARSRQCAKRGGAAYLVPLDACALVSAERAAELVALDDALKRLAKLDLRKSLIVEMRYFGGLSIDDTAKVLNVSPETVVRDWRMARTWLRRELNVVESSDA